MSSQIILRTDVGSKDHTTTSKRLKSPAEDKQKRSAKSAAASLSPKGKPALILTLLSRAKGATIEQLKDATGWQAHSIRASLSSLRKMGIPITRASSKSGASVYHAGNP